MSKDFFYANIQGELSVDLHKGVIYSEKINQSRFLQAILFNVLYVHHCFKVTNLTTIYYSKRG